jgi:hypothetical protein
MTSIRAHFLSILLLAAASVLASACSRQDSAADSGMRKTKFPGMVTADGGTSGEVIARAQKPVKDGTNTGGTPFHGGGAEGTTGGAATAGTVQESGHGPSGKTAAPDAKQPPKGQ